MSPDEQAIRELIRTWHTASQAGDLPTVLSLMSEDVVFLTAGHAPMRGRAAFAAASQGGASAFDIQGTTDIQEIRVCGELAYAWSHLSVTMTPRDGSAPTHRAGDALTIFRKQVDGRWLLARDANLMTMQ
jgi:uncharacterized protein (TIGR02246 family)